MNQTSVIKDITETLEAAGCKLGKGVTEKANKIGFNSGEGWSSAGFGGVKRSSTVRAIVDPNGTTIGNILIRKEKITGMKGLTEVFVTPANDTSKGFVVWNSDCWGYSIDPAKIPEGLKMLEPVN